MQCLICFHVHMRPYVVLLGYVTLLLTVFEDCWAGVAFSFFLLPRYDNSRSMTMPGLCHVYARDLKYLLIIDRM